MKLFKKKTRAELEGELQKYKALEKERYDRIEERKNLAALKKKVHKTKYGRYYHAGRLLKTKAQKAGKVIGAGAKAMGKNIKTDSKVLKKIKPPKRKSYGLSPTNFSMGGFELGL